MNKYELAGNELLKKYNINIKTYRGNLTGIAYIEDRIISAPKPIKPLHFAIFAHEVGHIANGEISPRWLEELKAWQFSIAQFKLFGFRIPSEVKSRMKYSLAFALAKALNRNMKAIPRELKPYKKYLSPITYLYGDGHRAQKWHADYWKARNL